MLKREFTLSDVVDYFKKNQVPYFEEEIDEYGGYFITAARLAAVILAPTPLIALSNFCSGIDAASLRVSKLFAWLPDKFKYANKGREKLAIKRYELSSIIYIKLLDIAILNAFNDILAPVMKDLLKNFKIEVADQQELKRLTEEAENAQLKISIDTFAKVNKQLISEIIGKIIDPLLPFLIRLHDKYYEETDAQKAKKGINLNDLKIKFEKKVYTLFNMFLINFSTEFPDFSLWCDIKDKEAILNELSYIRENITSKKLDNNLLLDLHKGFESTTNEILARLELLNRDVFVKTKGFPSFDEAFEQIFKVQTENIIERIDEKIKNNITAHHNKIVADVELPLSNNNDIEEIVYPKNKDIYVAQSFQSILYKKKEHRKFFLTTSSFNNITQQGEDVGKFLLVKLIDPNSALMPIIILGNPGAGKSLFSKMFAAKLCDTLDYIPFLVRLRDVASSSANISEHINKGIAQSIGLTQDINWIEWAKLFKTRAPVIILDGFDELMQSSKVELNGYINTIKELQESLLHHNICLRIILTSRIAVMQDVTIPDGTTIIKLNPFDNKRKDLWINIWNLHQTKLNYRFVLPKNDKILELAQEPLLLFMLAVYDFPAAELQSIAQDKSFNQSKLYDSLLKDFGLRQLEKEEYYRNANPESKNNEQELFRLRLGMIALLMFLKETTNKDIQRLDEELKICKLNNSKIKPIDVLTGFFFVHQNKSTTVNETENYNYEFLHKSFGEFLTADFLLKIALKQKDKRSRDWDLFQFCYGYNWLHRHSEIQRFLFEYASQVFDLKNHEQDRIVEEIQYALANLFDKTIDEFPLSRFTIVEPKSKIEHLAIYSQNLIFLWLALYEVGDEVPFDVLGSTNTTTVYYQRNGKEDTFNYLAQDRDEFDQDKLLWKRISSLWQLVGNYQSVAKVYEWIEVIEGENIVLKMRKEKAEIRNNFSDASLVACNEFNYIISLMDSENKIVDCNSLLAKLKNIYKKKPELRILGNDILIFRLSDFANNQVEIFDFLLEGTLSPKQLSNITEKFIFFSESFTEVKRAEIGERIFKISYDRDLAYTKCRLLIYLINYRHIRPVSSIFRSIDAIMERIEPEKFLMNVHYGENQIILGEYLKLINELSNIFAIHVLLRPKMFEALFDRIYSDFKYIIHNHPQIVIEFLKVTKTIAGNYKMREYFRNDFFKLVLERLFSDMMYIDSENPVYSIEYMRLVNELSEDAQLQKYFNSEMLSDLLYNMKTNFRYIVHSNPHLALEFVKLIKRFGKKIEIKEYFNTSFFEEIFDLLFSEVRFVEVKDSSYLIAYFKLINDLGRNISIQKYLHPRRLNELLSSKDSDFRYILRENPQIALEFLKVVKLFGNKGEIREYFNSTFFEELFDLLFLGVRDIGGENADSILGIIKFINEIGDYISIDKFAQSKTFNEVFYIAGKNIRHIRYEYPQIVLEYLKLMIKFNKEQDAIDIFPELRESYINNPEKFLKFLETFILMFNNENRN